MDDKLHHEWNDTNMAVRAITVGWPLRADQLQLCVDKLHNALESATSARDITRLVGAFARLYGQNQADRLAAKYAIPVGEEVGVRILPPHQIANLMDSSIPSAEYIVEAKANAKDTTGSPLSLPLSPVPGFGDGVFDTSG